MSAFGRQDAAGGGHGLLVRFFDVLHVDGTDLIDLPLAQRQVKLDALEGDLAVPRVVTADPSEAQALFDDAIAQGHECAGVKALDSTYDARPRGGSWRKLTPAPTLPLHGLASARGPRAARGGSGPKWRPVHRPDRVVLAADGGTVGARAGCRTSGSAPATPTAAS